MKVVIFGGGGFVGSAIANQLADGNHDIRIFERPGVKPYRHFTADDRIEWQTGDFMNIHDIEQAINGFDIVLHLISTTLPKNSNENIIYDLESNLVSTINLLNAMVSRQIRKIVFISSGGTVYGTPSYIPIDEGHPTEPQVSYGITKLAIEKYLLLYQRIYGIKVIILRVSNPYGERQRVETSQGAVSIFLSRAIQKQPIEIWGDGRVTRDYIYVSDVADAFIRAIEYDGPKSVFNISSGTGTNLIDLINLIEHVLGYKVICQFQPSRSFDVPINILNNSLARHELGWTSVVGLEEGISKTEKWIRKNLDK